jgi:hypothetical protein
MKAVFDNHSQSSVVVDLVGKFKHNKKDMLRLDSFVNHRVEGANFKLIPADLKSTLNRYWELVKSFNTAVSADDDIRELLGWKEGE